MIDFIRSFETAEGRLRARDSLVYNHLSLPFPTANCIGNVHLCLIVYSVVTIYCDCLSELADFTLTTEDFTT